ncbi:hypothetical protein [Sphingomonas koreensis]|uniref:hypothetical protein n=1 Tax=Sphingomonas koreensis TaxID=93064 RepID=UPI000F7ED5E7|nr:hypothetical protein [Sphingomonas koreensis]RSU21210.1 hypothetical protein CA224_06820 [Sphingomonas koreensis]RSU32225.1 hypothetical protein CA225_02665 [Sphingomonas koreensis]RSU35719.1 hypothetical protein BRX39_08835 [Sphingomonas koreensis]RSU49890.1 hypothetical protein CA221_12455 [Sphingomonas koreensis]RSU83487.1 hypothetical protein CA253_21315 [Sphingomonas koreensis]
MKIKVLRDYCGAEGTDVDKNVFAGDEHIVTRDRAAQLVAVGLVDIIGDDEHPEDAEAEATGAEPAEDGEKIAPIASKAARTPSNKKAPKAPNKAKGEQPA